MIFLELVLENFGPYLGRQVLNLRPELSQPIILLGGMNGGGKTTLMDAIRLVLYGHRAECSTRGNLSYTKFLKQCVNRNANPDEKTRLELSIGVVNSGIESEFRIIRYWTKEDSKDTLGILSGEFPDRALEETWDDYIENLLPLGISNLFLFDGEQVKELAEMDAPPPVVVEAIQSLLGLELAEKLDIDLDILSRRQQKELADKDELSDLDEIEAKSDRLKQERENVAAAIEKMNKNLEIAEKRYNVSQNKFLTEGGKLAAEKSQFDLQRKAIANKIEQTRDILVKLASASLPLALIESLLQSGLTQGKAERESMKARISRDRIQERDRRLLDYLQTLSLPDDTTSQVADFLQEDSETLAEDILSADNTWLNAKPETLENLERLIAYKVPAQVEKANVEWEYLEKLNSELTDTERKIAAAASPEQYQALIDTMKKAEEKWVKLKGDRDEKQRKLKEIDRALADGKKDLKKYTETFLERKNSAHMVCSIARVKTILEQFREKLTLKKLNKLENQVTECFRYLLHKSDLVHRVVIDTHNFSLSLYDLEGKFLPKYRLSAGEKQLLAIAFLWGLARVSGRQIPVAIDTPLGRLDSSHRQNLIERYFPSAARQVILLSTDTEIAQTEVENLRNQEAIAREYRLAYDASTGQTTFQEGYFEF
ncbi:DNA sulfur modification protein DndD [Roseofilum casamattae]|uniref:Nuclease SbcCD subunit C n=1 Tax=Roseofilum casamattae BLCC-M143 TaxID=3022442 RepID=A0ABT7C1H6_9CYAN|nr:DNA sulfur modification protein DndD [Roseofilum casamattae]MDJ1185290.1 DNA sulfur modification protein DndD [Roseofilum casamattae BLCC-M143]